MSVLAAGAVEVFAILTLSLGLSTVMVVAMLTTGLNPLNALVLLSALTVFVLGTGRLSLWNPERALVGD